MTRVPPALLALPLAALAAPAFAADRHYAVEDFDRITVEGPYIVRLVTGRASAAIAHGAPLALDRMSLEVQDQVLRIRRNANAWSASAAAAGTVTIELATRSLRGVRLAGPARFETDLVRGPNVAFAVEGAATLRASHVDVDSLSLALIGSGRLDIAGAARTLSANVQGSGDLAAPGLVARNATVAAASSGAVALTVNGPATVANDGVGAVRIYGHPVCAISGSNPDQVRCGGVPSNQGQAR